MALSLLVAPQSFQAPAVRMAAARAPAATMFSEGDIGVLPPLGVYDPLGLIGTRDMKRYEVMEIKHGRAAMLGFVHTILIEAGARFPGYISPTAGLKFEDIPSGNFAALEALPTAGWLQIMTVTCMMETGYFLFEAQDPAKAAGDIGGAAWTRYDDAVTKTFKLNVRATAPARSSRRSRSRSRSCRCHSAASAVTRSRSRRYRT